MIFGFAVYFNTLNSPFYMDDYGQIIINPDIKNLSNIPTFYFKTSSHLGGNDIIIPDFYRPIFLSVYTLLYAGGKGLPLFFHLFQVGVFSINSVLVFLFFNKFFKRKLAFLLALLFLVHPANEEAAQYIAALSEPLFFCFGIIALHLVSSKRVKNFSTIFFYSLMILFSFLSKETGVLFLVICLTYVFLFQKSYFRNYFLASSFVGIIYLILRFLASKNPATVSIELYRFSSFGDQLVIVSKVIFYYIEQIATPTLFLPDSTYLESAEIKSAVFPFIISALVISILVIVGFWIRRYFKSSFKVYLFFLIWFLIGIGLHSQIIPLDVVIASRWIYFPIAGALGMFGVVIKLLAPYFLRYRILLLVLYFVYLSMCIYVTERLNIYRSNFKSYTQQL